MSASAGEPYQDRLLRLPSFLLDVEEGEAPGQDDLVAGFRMTGYFLTRHVFEPRGLAAPQPRDDLLRLLKGRA